MTQRLQPVVLDPEAPADAFPPDEAALAVPNGLVAVGGDLSQARLLAAYRRGIFPWYEQGQPVLWWTPEPRLVLDPRRLHVSRSLRRTLRRGRFEVTFDKAFAAVIRCCAAPRPNQHGLSWITPDMIRAYERLHACGYARSIEVWRNGRLAGGVYGVKLGAAFFGESMFSREPDASKVALVALCAHFAPTPASLIDCQVPSAHLLGLGAESIPRGAFLAALAKALAVPVPWP
jgi:leucyl/phenylalanyl-tRNA---protein transferase